MIYHLVAQTGPAAGQAVTIRATKLFIGTDANCHIRPNVSGLGKVHALIEQREGNLYVRDFGAEGGTTVNDLVLRAKESQVFDGDLLQIGPLVLKFVWNADELSERPLKELPAPGWPFGDMDAAPAPAATKAAPRAPEPAPAAAKASPPPPAPAPSTPPSPPTPEFAPTAASTIPSSVTTAPRAAPVYLSGAVIPSQVIPAATQALAAGEEILAGEAITYRTVGDVLVVTPVHSELNDEATVGPMRYEIRSLLDLPLPRRVVINLQKVEYLSSRAVGVILAHYQGLDRHQGTMRVCCIHPKVMPVLQQMRLTMLIDVFDTLEEAIQTPWE